MSATIATLDKVKALDPCTPHRPEDVFTVEEYAEHLGVPANSTIKSRLANMVERGSLEKLNFVGENGRARVGYRIIQPQETPNARGRARK